MPSTSISELQCKCNNGVAEREISNVDRNIQETSEGRIGITYAKSLFKATKEIDDAPCIEMSHVKTLAMNLYICVFHG